MERVAVRLKVFLDYNYWSNSLWTLPSLQLSNCFPLWWVSTISSKHTHCCTFVSFLYFTSTSNYFDTSFLVTLWAVVNHCYFLLRTIWVAHVEHSFDGHQLHSQWACEFWNRCYSLWLLEVFHNAMLRGQVLEVSESRKAHMEYKGGDRSN